MYIIYTKFKGLKIIQQKKNGDRRVILRATFRINIINSSQHMHLKGWDLHRYHPNAGPNSFVEEDDIIKTSI